MTPTIKLYQPHTIGKAMISRFCLAIVLGGEVSGDALVSRIRDAAWLAVVTADGVVCAVGALKRPTEHHREVITEGSGIDVSSESYKYELGWLVVGKQARGHKLSRLLVAALLEKAGDSGVFCTVRVDNFEVQTACKDFGFVQAGETWQGEHGMLGLGIWKPQP